MLRPGEILDQKYKILSLVGTGGMSRVWLAADITMDNKLWAIKEIDKNSREYKATVNQDKMLREIRIMKKLDHPALPRIVSLIDGVNTICVVMDYIEGDTLRNILKKYGPQSSERVAEWMIPVCDVLDYLHTQDPPIIYRDMKPSNIMLTPDGNIKIIDFGIAREYKGNAEDTQPLGTTGYASPEHRTKHTDARSDVYTVGTTMYQLLTGENPTDPLFHMVPIRQINPTLSTGLEKIILKATALNPDDRYQTARDLANALNSYKQLEEGYIMSLEAKVRKFRNRLFAAAGVILLGCVLAVSGILIDKSNYEKLLAADTPNQEERASNLRQAIDIKPDREEAYLELVKAYSQDGKFTEQEAEAFASVYNEHRPTLRRRKDYPEISFSIGEAFLKYYTGKTDNSSRAKLLAAEPFFTDANVKGFEKKALAGSYVFMANYYRDYIIADGSLISKDPSQEDYLQLISNCENILDAMDQYSGDGADKMRLIAYDMIINIIESQRGDMVKSGIEKKKLEGVMKSVLDSLNGIPVSEGRDALIREAEGTITDISATYKNQRKKQRER